jgi:cytochrome c biogenesis protein CcdA
VIIGGSIAADNAQKQWWRPLVITGSLAASVVVFSLLLKATTSLLGVPQTIWSSVSGILVMVLGISIVFPHAWEWLALKSGLYNQSNKLLQKSGKTRPGVAKDVLLGAALGPAFSSCSPTYALIVAVVLPRSFSEGLVYLIAYALGLATVLLLAAVAGQSLVKGLGWLGNPNGLFRKIIGVLFILVGLAVLTGLDRDIQSYVLEKGWYDPIIKVENTLR